MIKARNTTAHGISALGLAVILIELYRHWRFGSELELTVVFVGACIAWAGGYMAAPKRAIEGGAFLIDGTTKLVQVFRSGRRSSDRDVVVEQQAAVVVTKAPNEPKAGGE